MNERVVVDGKDICMMFFGTAVAVISVVTWRPELIDLSARESSLAMVAPVY